MVLMKVFHFCPEAHRFYEFALFAFIPNPTRERQRDESVENGEKQNVFFSNLVVHTFSAHFHLERQTNEDEGS